MMGKKALPILPTKYKRSRLAAKCFMNPPTGRRAKRVASIIYKFRMGKSTPHNPDTPINRDDIILEKKNEVESE